MAGAGLKAPSMRGLRQGGNRVGPSATMPGNRRISGHQDRVTQTQKSPAVRLGFGLRQLFVSGTEYGQNIRPALADSLRIFAYLVGETEVKWSRQMDLNPQPSDYKSEALWCLIRKNQNRMTTRVEIEKPSTEAGLTRLVTANAETYAAFSSGSRDALSAALTVLAYQADPDGVLSPSWFSRIAIARSVNPSDR
jgi:hypothetical protein